jgi:protein O-GlcNAc transferase
MPPDVIVDGEGQVVDGVATEGWITRVLDVCAAQIPVPFGHNIGVIAASRTLEEWLAFVQSITGATFDTRALRRWKVTLSRFFRNQDSPRMRLNEPGFYIRLVELLERRVQRKWYLDLYGRVTSTTRHASAKEDKKLDYLRPLLPAAVGPPPVPAVLPFHTVSPLWHTLCC